MLPSHFQSFFERRRRSRKLFVIARSGATKQSLFS